MTISLVKHLKKKLRDLKTSFLFFLNHKIVMAQNSFDIIKKNEVRLER